jgi:hypothetical protein
VTGPGGISIIIDDTGQEILQHHEVTIAKETLGVYLAMDGNNKEETLHLHEVKRKLLQTS